MNRSKLYAAWVDCADLCLLFLLRSGTIRLISGGFLWPFVCCLEQLHLHLGYTRFQQDSKGTPATGAGQIE